MQSIASIYCLFCYSLIMSYMNNLSQYLPPRFEGGGLEKAVQAVALLVGSLLFLPKCRH